MPSKTISVRSRSPLTASSSSSINYISSPLYDMEEELASISSQGRRRHLSSSRSSVATGPVHNTGRVASWSSHSSMANLPVANHSPVPSHSPTLHSMSENSSSPWSPPPRIMPERIPSSPSSFPTPLSQGNRSSHRSESELNSDDTIYSPMTQPLSSFQHPPNALFPYVPAAAHEYRSPLSGQGVYGGFRRSDEIIIVQPVS